MLVTTAAGNVPSRHAFRPRDSGPRDLDEEASGVAPQGATSELRDLNRRLSEACLANVKLKAENRELREVLARGIVDTIVSLSPRQLRLLGDDAIAGVESLLKELEGD